ncbi:hypothetical protein [Phytoactinopolyspora limicola]|uniref:hypothetical protein n=1 Tax=Phytoactinopolyspora limicola TaxID=2715536 RepID=UPI001407925A|nr:hypothetical protein [Phytoactinopolyspora limicola]
MKKNVALVVGLAVIVSVIAVGVYWTFGDGPGGARDDVPTASTTAEPAATATPTAACAAPPDHDHETSSDCVPIDVEDYLRDNRAYRERDEPDADAQQSADEALPAIEGALAPLAERDMVSPQDIRDTLAAAGYDQGVQIRPFTDDDTEPLPAVTVAVATGGACVFGTVSTEAAADPGAGTLESGVELEVGGFIADGGCLPAH